MTHREIQAQRSRYQERMGHHLKPLVFLFDMDGVLYDSMPGHERSWLETAAHYKLPMTRDDVYLFEGQTGPQTIELLMQRAGRERPSPEEIREIYELKTQLFNQYNTGQLIPYAREVVAAVADYKRVLVTGSSQSSLLDRLSEHFPGAFSRESMVTGLDVQRGKPDPEPYLRGLTIAHAVPWQGIVIENAPQGVRAAHAAGCFTIAVNTGPLSDNILKEEGADLVCPDMKTLLEFLPAILQPNLGD